MIFVNIIASLAVIGRLRLAPWVWLWLIIFCPSLTAGTGVDAAWTRAVQTADLPALKLMIAQVSQVDTRSPTGKTALMMVARHGDYDLATSLLDRGADADAVNHKGGSVLMYAAQSGHAELCYELLARGADVNAVASNGWTPLMVAVAKNHPNIVRLFLKHGAKINYPDVYGWTPLIRAVHEQRRGIIEALLSNSDIDLSARDESEATALHHAVINGDDGLVSLLLAYGANTKLRDRQGRTPLDVAIAKHDKNIIALLKN